MVTPKYVIGFHGTTEKAAKCIVNNKAFFPSLGPIEWLGSGVYFWQDSPLRAISWAEQVSRKNGDKPAVIKSKIELYDCIDLLDLEWHSLVRLAFHKIQEKNSVQGVSNYLQRALLLPRIPNDNNTFTVKEREAQKPAVGLNHLDCEVMNVAFTLYQFVTGKFPKSSRAPFVEGDPLFPSSHLYNRSHIQICVRDPTFEILSDLEIISQESFSQWTNNAGKISSWVKEQIPQEYHFDGKVLFPLCESVFAHLNQTDFNGAKKEYVKTKSLLKEMCPHDAKFSKLRSDIHAAIEEFFNL